MATDTQTPANELERRKQVRIRLRSDLEIAPQKYEGRTYWVVKDPVSLRYYRFKEQENFLLDFMDGKRTLDEAQKEYEKRFRPERLTLEDLEHFAQQLLQAGLAQNESPRAGQQLFDRRKKRRRREWMQTLTNILYIKLPVYDPDRLLTWMLQYTRWMFTTWFLLLSVGVMLAALLLVGTHFQTFWDKLPNKEAFFSFKTVAYLWVALGVVKVIHEFGHGLSCKAFGGEVHEMGALFLVFSPCLYANVSDAWTLPNKWHRIIISAAGIYVELIIAAISTFVWWNTPSHPFINNLALSLMVVCSVSTVVFNANPLMRYDGYYVLADLLEIPNLRDRANRYLKNVFLEHCLGVEVQPEPYMALWRRLLFLLYAVISYIYRWVVTFGILMFMDSFLKPYKLGVISRFMMLFALGSMIGWPLYNLGKNLHKRGRLPDMKRGRVLATTAVFSVVAIAFFLLPLPVSRVRGSALVQVQPDYVEKVYLHINFPCVLEELYVKDGQPVEQGQVLARFSCRELDAQQTESETQVKIREEQIKALRRQLASSFDAQEQEKIRVQIEQADGERKKYAAESDYYREQQKKLELRAPRDGVVTSPPKVDEVGKLWEKEKEAPFCGIGDLTQLRALLPVGPADYQLLRDDLDDLKDRDGLDVDLRVQGRAHQTWKGRLSNLPQSEAKDIPMPLTNKAGGPIAIKPSSKQGQMIPQSQQYLIPVDIVNPDGAICPGTLAQVKVHCKWRSGAWWAWRKISETFDLGLM